MKRDFTIGTIDTGRATRAVVTIHVEWTPPGEERLGQVRPEGSLSITADAKRPRASDIDEGGQMQNTLRTTEIEYAPSWSAEKLATLLDVWDTYHLNDMQAGCEHQRELGWTYDEHPAEACPECGYRMGTEWKTMPVPNDVIQYLFSLQSTIPA
jgi:hypothetical protein